MGVWTDTKSPAYDKLMNIPGAIEIVAGILERGDEEHGDDGLSLLELATIHEFGNGHVPERSFIRAWFDENQGAIQARLLTEFKKEVVTGDWIRAGERVALWCKASIQKRIAAGIAPPNAASTIARKGSATPLIDSGVLRSAIEAEARIQGSGSSG